MLKHWGNYEIDSKGKDKSESGESKGVVLRIFDTLKKACFWKGKEPKQGKGKAL